MNRKLKWGISIGAIVSAIAGVCVFLVIRSNHSSADDDCTIDLD